MITYSTAAPNFNELLDIVEGTDPTKVDFNARTASYADFPLDEYRLRYSRLCDLMQHAGMDAILVTQEENVRYFTGYTTVLWISKFRPYVGILPADPKVPAGLAVPTQERGNAESTAWVPEATVYHAQESPIGYIVAALEERGLTKGRIGIELGFGQRLGMNQEQLHTLVEALPDVEFVDATPLCQAVRMIKSGAEIERLAKAAEISTAGVESGWRALRPGVSERELLAVMATSMFEHGAEVGTKPAFFGILSGPRWGYANSAASDYAVQSGDFVLVDGGATYRGYVCDFIRLACVGTPTEQQRDWAAAAIEANDAALEAVRPGVPAHVPLDAATTVFAERGLSAYTRLNIVGHGIGMDVHEVPWLGAADRVYTSETRLREGMVLCVEPGIAPDPDGKGPRGNFIVEEVVAVERAGCRVLTSGLSKQVWLA